MDFAQIDGETTAAWLRRLIKIGAPPDIRADVRALLDNERPGSNLFPLIPICSSPATKSFDSQLILPPILSSFNLFIL